MGSAEGFIQTLGTLKVLKANRCGDPYYGGRGCGGLGRVLHSSPPNFDITQASPKQRLREFSLVNKTQRGRFYWKTRSVKYFLDKVKSNL